MTRQELAKGIKKLLQRSQRAIYKRTALRIEQFDNNPSYMRHTMMVMVIDTTGLNSLEEGDAFIKSETKRITKLLKYLLDERDIPSVIPLYTTVKKELCTYKPTHLSVHLSYSHGQKTLTTCLKFIKFDALKSVMAA